MKPFLTQLLDFAALKSSAAKAKALTALLVGSLVYATAFTAAAQVVKSNFFGINMWYGQPNATQSTDLKKAGLNLYRLGGNGRNNDAAYLNMYNWVSDIEYVKYTLNAEPIIQLPIGLSFTAVKDWVYFFNVTKGYDIKYWTIGNEPDPGGGYANLQNWMNGQKFYQSSINNLNYGDFKYRFVNLANELKQASDQFHNGQCIIVGPDFRLFYKEAIDLEYSRFLTDVGNSASTNGKPLLDVFAFHYYATQADAESVLKARFDGVQALLNTANGLRSFPDLPLAVTEVNGEASTGTALPYWFNTGQFVATMTKLALAKGAFCVTPWSIYESAGNRGTTDFSFYNSDNTRRPTMHHFAMLSENKRAEYMPEAQANYADQLVCLGMRQAGTGGGYTVMLMNTTSAARSFNISLNNAYQGTTSDVQIRMQGYAGVTNTPLTGSIPATTTFLFRCDAAGNFISKLIFSQSDAGPHLRQALATAPGTSGEPDLAVYPNPVAGSFALAGLAGPADLTVRNTLGDNVLHQQVAAGEAVDISALPAGLYLLDIRTANAHTVRKMVKQ